MNRFIKLWRAAFWESPTNPGKRCVCGNVARGLALAALMPFLWCIELYGWWREHAEERKDKGRRKSWKLD